MRVVPWPVSQIAGDVCLGQQLQQPPSLTVGEGTEEVY